MLNKKEIQTILNQSLETGADFAEMFFEDSKTDYIKIIGKEVNYVNSSNIFGVGLRVLKGEKEAYAYTNNISFDNISQIMNNLKLNFKDNPNKVIALKNSLPLKNQIKKKFNSLSKEKKAQKMLDLSNIMKNYDHRIVQTIVSLLEKEQKVLIANTDGTYQKDVRNYIRCNMMAVAKKGKEMQEVYEGPGYSMGLEFFDLINLKTKALEIAQRAVNLLDAQEIKPQKMPVVINNGFGGVLFHEACGHLLEATAIAKGFSPFCGKINQKIASEIVTAYDDGTIKNAWGSSNFDDEGKKTQKNLLIERGILKNYLIDYKNGKKMKMSSTGSARRESYKYSPTSRMNSTYIENGKDIPEQIIKDTKYGLYAKNLGGGTVIPLTGEFNFIVNEGYLIENGKLTKLVKGAMLIGYGDKILPNIDRVGNDLSLTQGICGSISGSLPVDVGQPTIRIKEMIVGGKERE